jgi:O-methyltransferase
LRRLTIKIISIMKGIFFLLRPGVYLTFLATPFIFVGNSLRLSKWISIQRRKGIPFDDFFRLNRNYADRFKLHSHVVETENIRDEPIIYLEFGVASGTSFEWWLKSNTNPQSRFYGFDTFEGLPEAWGLFKKGEMGPGTTDFHDSRYNLIKGLFQDTVPSFLKTTNLDPSKKKIIHLDADLFSSTMFVLASLANLLKPGDILIFDEFCVPNHEFFAFDIFSQIFNLKCEMLGAVNNYLQIALKVVE